MCPVRPKLRGGHQGRARVCVVWPVASCPRGLGPPAADSKAVRTRAPLSSWATLLWPLPGSSPADLCVWAPQGSAPVPLSAVFSRHSRGLSQGFRSTLWRCRPIPQPTLSLTTPFQSVAYLMCLLGPWTWHVQGGILATWSCPGLPPSVNGTNSTQLLVPQTQAPSLVPQFLSSTQVRHVPEPGRPPAQAHLPSVPFPLFPHDQSVLGTQNNFLGVSKQEKL